MEYRFNGVDSPKRCGIVAIAAEFFKSLGLSADESKILVNDAALWKRTCQIRDRDAETRKKDRHHDKRDKLSEKDWEIFGTGNPVSLTPAHLED